MTGPDFLRLPQADAAYLGISDADIEPTRQLEPGFILDDDADERIAGVEVLSIFRRGSQPLPEVA